MWITVGKTHQVLVLSRSNYIFAEKDFKSEISFLRHFVWHITSLYLEEKIFGLHKGEAQILKGDVVIIPQPETSTNTF